MSRKRISIFAGAIVLVRLLAAGAMAAFSSSSRDEAMPPPTFGGPDEGARFAEVEMESATEASMAAPEPSMAISSDAAGAMAVRGAMAEKAAAAPAALAAEPELIAEVAPRIEKSSATPASA